MAYGLRAMESLGAVEIVLCEGAPVVGAAPHALTDFAQLWDLEVVILGRQCPHRRRRLPWPPLGPASEVGSCANSEQACPNKAIVTTRAQPLP